MNERMVPMSLGDTMFWITLKKRMLRVLELLIVTMGVQVVRRKLKEN